MEGIGRQNRNLITQKYFLTTTGLQMRTRNHPGREHKAIQRGKYIICATTKKAKELQPHPDLV